MERTSTKHQAGVADGLCFQLLPKYCHISSARAQTANPLSSGSGQMILTVPARPVCVCVCMGGNQRPCQCARGPSPASPAYPTVGGHRFAFVIVSHDAMLHDILPVFRASGVKWQISRPPGRMARTDEMLLSPSRPGPSPLR